MADEYPHEPADAPAATDDPSARPGGDPAGDPPAPDARAEAPPSDVEALTRERDDLYDRLLRTTAEFDNYRRRVERERREQADQKVTALLQEILLIADDFDRALAIESQGSVEAYRQGVALISNKLQEMLRRHGVRPIEAVGQDFDPNLHEAVSYEPSPGARDGEVISELRRGYTLNDRLLRPAMVKVARA